MNILHESIKNHDLKTFETHLNSCNDFTCEEITKRCESFKTLAVKILSEPEFVQFRRIMCNYYAKKSLKV